MEAVHMEAVHMEAEGYWLGLKKLIFGTYTRSVDLDIQFYLKAKTFTFWMWRSWSGGMRTATTCKSGQIMMETRGKVWPDDDLTYVHMYTHEWTGNMMIKRQYDLALHRHVSWTYTCVSCDGQATLVKLWAKNWMLFCPSMRSHTWVLEISGTTVMPVRWM